MENSSRKAISGVHDHILLEHVTVLQWTNKFPNQHSRIQQIYVILWHGMPIFWVSIDWLSILFAVAIDKWDPKNI